MNARPSVLCSDAAVMPRGGFTAQQVRQGICQRGTTTRQGERSPGPRGPETLTKKMGKWNVQDLAVVLNGRMRALAQVGGCGAKVTGLADGTDLAPTEPDTGCGHVTRKGHLEDKQGQGHEMEGRVYGWTVRVLIEAATKIPLAVKVGQSHEHEALGTRALVTQARRNLAGAARRHKVIFDQGCLAGSTLWWRPHQGGPLVGPGNATMAVVVAARAQPVGGEEIAGGRRGHTGRRGQGRTACTERLETEVGGLTGLTTSDPSGTPAHGRQHHRRDVPPHPIHAVVVRQGPGKDDGPGGTTVFLTNASGAEPRQAFADADDRRLLENCGIKEAKQPWDLGHPPQKSERAVRGHVMFTMVMFALATADRLPCEREASGGEPVGGPRWRRQRREQTRDQVRVCAEGHDGLFHLAAYALLGGVNLQDIPPDLGSRQQVLVKDRLPAQG